MKVILASSSPRRAELLKKIGLSFRVSPAEIEEGVPIPPWSEWVKTLAENKALAVSAEKDEVTLAADTVVVCKGRALGKPVDSEEALEMLRMLAGGVHEVMTGVCTINGLRTDKKGVAMYRDVEITRVHFRDLTEQEITTYVASGEPFDKAGAYGIQGLGALLVEKIEGCYYNVVGLPLVKTMLLLRRCGINVLGAGGK